MVITLTPASGPSVELGNDADKAYISEFRPELDQLIGISHPIRADYALHYGRQNVNVTISFSVSRTHTDPDDALLFLLRVPLDTPLSGLLSVTHKGTTIHYAAADLVSVRDAGSKGEGTRLAYAFLCGQPSITPP